MHFFSLNEHTRDLFHHSVDGCLHCFQNFAVMCNSLSHSYIQGHFKKFMKKDILVRKSFKLMFSCFRISMFHKLFEKVCIF